MHRQHQYTFLSLAFMTLVAITTGCGVSDTSHQPSTQTDHQTTALPTKVLPTITAGDSSTQALTATTITWGQALDATKVAAMEHWRNDTSTFPTAPIPTRDPVMMTARALRAQTAASVKPPRITPYSTVATPLAGRGTLYDDGGQIFASDTFIGKNGWTYENGDTLFSVYAGRQGPGPNHDQDFNQGVVVVRIIDIPSGTARSTTFYKTPRSDGPARIVDVRIQAAQMDLTIATEGGSLYLFNVNTGLFSPGR